MAEDKTLRIITPMPAALVEMIDDFRYRQRIPSRAEAIRRLIETGLKESDGPREAKPRR